MQLQNGSLYCQVLDAFDGRVQLHKVSQLTLLPQLLSKDCNDMPLQVNFAAKQEHEMIPNYKQLQAALTALGITQVWACLGCVHHNHQIDITSQILLHCRILNGNA